ncbi:MAG: hypothetical protein ACREAD_03340, partial [Nitrosopumilaceae archaeon]
MYNETLRKITSLSLLTILLTSTAAFAMPNALPQAHAATNANLFVSAENSQWNNYFAGPQVIQVVIVDPDLNRLDQAYGEPTVTVNGKKLRMAQATDGNWYAYFADRGMALNADKTQPVGSDVPYGHGVGLDFGSFCGSASTFGGGILPTFTETKGVTFAKAITTSNSNPTSTSFPSCNTDMTGAGNVLTHVVRQAKALNQVTPQNSLNIPPAVWPIIQLFDFGGTSIPSSVTVQYQKGGSTQSTSLTFDRIPTSLISTSVDRTAYPTNSQVFFSLNDPQLNVDPTEEDSWTFGTNQANPQLYYMAFNRNGGEDADANAIGMSNLTPVLSNLMFNHNGKITVSAASSTQRVIDFQANGRIIYQGTQRNDPAVVSTLNIAAGSQPLTLQESGGINTGTFAINDGGKKSQIITLNNNAIRGQSATIRYNDVSTSIVGGFGFATMSVTPVNDTWSSGEKIPVTLIDTDQNKNSKITEHLDNSNPAVTIPAMTIGTPFIFTQGAGSTYTFVDPTLVFNSTTGVVNSSSINFTGISSSTNPVSASQSPDVIGGQNSLIFF